MVKIALAVEPSLAYHEASYGLSRLGRATSPTSSAMRRATSPRRWAWPRSSCRPPPASRRARCRSTARGGRSWRCRRRPSSAQLALDWAVVPLLLDEASGIEELWSKATEAVVRAGLAGPGDRVVLTSGTRVGRPGATNSILVQAL